MKSNLKVILLYVVLIAVILVVTATMLGGIDKEKTTYSDIISLFKEEQVKSFVIDEYNVISITTQDDKQMSFALRDLSMFFLQMQDTIDAQFEAGIIQSYDYEELTQLPWWVSLLPAGLLLIGLVIFWIVMMNQMGMGKGSKIASFGKAKAHISADDKEKTLFSDVAGADEEKEELMEVVEFLRDPGKFTRMGAKIPHGVLLVGPPGTGKTLLAKAVAGEAGVPFYSISGSDFVEMYVGVGASRVRDLFDTARKNPASIVFIDEIDAVGRHRGAGLGGGHDEREQTLNQLLVEMDGFNATSGVIVIAATNRPDILDPALLRPGRFDRQVTVDYPDVRGREEILKIHARNKPLENPEDLKVLAKTTIGFTGAGLANLLNEGALLAARKGKHLIGREDLEEAMIKVIVGVKKKSKVISEKEKRLTAYHEAGHAIVTHYISPETPVHQISVIPSGRAGGYTLSLPKDDRSYSSRTDMENEIATLLGGRMAEKLVLGDISTGASNDIQRATAMARNMVTRYGMSDLLGPVVYGSEHSSDEVFLGRDFSSSRNYSEDTAATIDSEIKRIVAEAYTKAEEILNAHMEQLHFIAAFLIKHELMEEELFRAAMNTPGITMEALEELLEEKKRQSEAANAERAAKEAEEKRLAEERRAAERAAREAAANEEHYTTDTNDSNYQR